MIGRQRLRLHAKLWALAIAVAICPSTSSLAEPSRAQSIAPLGITVNLAQVLVWVDGGQFAVGRWDGTISLFQVPQSPGSPIALQAFATRSGRGVEAMVSPDPLTLIVSDGAGNLMVMRRQAADAVFEPAAELAYDPAIGVANSGVAITVSGDQFVVTGHAFGHLLVWRRAASGAFALERTIDVRSPAQPANPWGIRNVRGLALWRDAIVIVGSEDGDLSSVDIRTGQEGFRVRYNEQAQRGVNSISVARDRLLVANCAVGDADNNIWLFDLSGSSPMLKDAENLELDIGRSQTFNFDADLSPSSDGTGTLTFFGSTEEGVLWQGRIENDQLVVTGATKVSAEGGAVAAVSPDASMIAVASGPIRLFAVQ